MLSILQLYWILHYSLKYKLLWLYQAMHYWTAGYDWATSSLAAHQDVRRVWEGDMAEAEAEAELAELDATQDEKG